jgi:signal transduction histidine kinase/ActR/RegA family two-component response regulator
MMKAELSEDCCLLHPTLEGYLHLDVKLKRLRKLHHNTCMQSFELSDISTSGRARLLEMIVQPRSGELSLLIIPLLIALYHFHLYGASLFLIWPACAWILAWSMHVGRTMILRKRTTQSDSEWVARALNAVLGHVTVYGLIWAMPIVLLAIERWRVGHVASIELSYMLYTALTAIVAICTNSLSSLLQFFERYFVGGWIVPALGVPFMFGGHGWVLLPLALLYGWIAFQHARTTHGFLVKQVQLEESSYILSLQYKQAKLEAEAARGAAEQALRDKSEFLRTASHDLRQPVHAMGLLVETLSRESHESALRPLLRDLQSSVRSVNLMFNSLLDLSKLEVNDQNTAPEPVDLQALLDELTALFKPEAERRGLQWRCYSPSKAAWVLADAAMLRQAVFNLTHNALRYTSAGGVLVGLRQRHLAEGAHWQIEVCDTGAGIAQQEQDQIFSPYYRSEHSWKIDSAGLGLGLAVFKQCAQRMQARYGMRSVLGRGSRFWLSLPQAHAASSAHLPHIKATALQHLSTLQGRCLLLDDDPLVRNAWQGLLQSWGLQAQLVADASEALACLDAGFDPQVIFCDQRLRSGESGFEVLQALLARCPLAKGGMISGELDAPELLEAREMGYTVLRKPVPADVMHAVLARWLGDEAFVQSSSSL